MRWRKLNKGKAKCRVTTNDLCYGAVYDLLKEFSSIDNDIATLRSPIYYFEITHILLLPSLPSYTSSQLLPSDIDISMIYNESNSYEAFSENNNYNISQELGVKDVVTAKHGSEVNDYNRLNEAGNNFIDSNEIENISNNINGL